MTFGPGILSLLSREASGRGKRHKSIDLIKEEPYHLLESSLLVLETDEASLSITVISPPR